MTDGGAYEDALLFQSLFMAAETDSSCENDLSLSNLWAGGDDSAA